MCPVNIDEIPSSSILYLCAFSILYEDVFDISMYTSLCPSAREATPLDRSYSLGPTQIHGEVSTVSVLVRSDS